MSDELLPYYQRELSFLRKMGSEFAEAHPDDAARLRLSADTCDDPHVERMIEAFAYLTARIRHKLDDDFPEITSALMSVLYPHYLAPIPSMAIVELTLDRGQGGLAAGLALPRETAIETESIGGSPCRFRTCYPVKLWPIEVVSASLGAVPFTAGKPVAAPGASTVLRIEMRCYANDMTFSKLALDLLRFYLKGQPQHVQALHELLFNNVIQVALTTGAQGSTPIRLNQGCIEPVGFNVDEGLLPYAARSFPGYRLLTEYFAFPEKYHFFDLTGLSPDVRKPVGNKFEILIYLNKSSADLEHNVSKDMFRLGCTPMVNLFRQHAEPIKMSGIQSQYHVVPDARRPLATEVYSIESVTASSSKGEKADYLPFYSFKHAPPDRPRPQTFWYSTRERGGPRDRRIDEGTEVYLSFVDLDFNPAEVADWTADVEVLCLNRDLPHKLPFGGGQPRLQLVEGGPISSVTCLTAPTPTLRPAYRHELMWRIISHLSLNHLSIADGGSPDALREILKLYDFASSASTQAKISSIQQVRSKRVVGRAGGVAAGGFCRGVEVDILFDEERFSDNGLFLFASVLERFFGLYCSVNSFSKLVARTRQRQGVMRQWPPRAAEKVLL